MKNTPNAQPLRRTRQELGMPKARSQWPNVVYIESVRFERVLSTVTYYSREAGQYLDISESLVDALSGQDVES